MKAPSSREPPSFLIVDDDVLIVHALARVLRPLGRATFTMEFDKVHVMAALTRPSLMLIDIDLPQVTGLEIVRRIRSNPDLDQMHIFVMTAHQSESILREARSLSINEVIAKPIDTEALVSRISALL